MTLKKISESLGLDEESCRELVTLLIDTSRSDMEKLKNANKDGNFGQVMAAAHSIKGASGNLGFMSLSAMAADLEKNAETVKNITMDETILKMEEELNRIDHSCR